MAFDGTDGSCRGAVAIKCARKWPRAARATPYGQRGRAHQILRLVWPLSAHLPNAPSDNPGARTGRSGSRARLRGDWRIGGD
eukprot:420886-Prymnesium_polylepis.1